MTTTALTFSSPPPGLEPLVEFDLAPVEGAEELYTLRSTLDPSVRLHLIDAERYAPLYAPAVSDDQLSTAGITSGLGTRVLLVVWFSEQGPSVNLQAPVLIDEAAGIAAQVILEEELPVRALLAELATSPS